MTPLVLLTKVDQGSEEVAADLKTLFLSDEIREAVLSVADDLGVPAQDVIPIKSYSHETSPTCVIDILVLRALSTALSVANDYLRSPDFKRRVQSAPPAPPQSAVPPPPPASAGASDDDIMAALSSFVTEKLNVVGGDFEVTDLDADEVRDWCHANETSMCQEDLGLDPAQAKRFLRKARSLFHIPQPRGAAARDRFYTPQSDFITPPPSDAGAA